MTEVLTIALRFGLYLDLMLLFGVPAFALYNFRQRPADLTPTLPVRTFVLATAATGVLLSVAGVITMAAAMSGAELAAVGRAEITAVLTATAFGTAALLRLAALVLVLSFMFPAPINRARMMVVLAFAAIALATLAWSGHAAMADSRAAQLHLVADILHLWAAGVWIGALAALLMLIGSAGKFSGARGAALYYALAAFALPGSILVATLLLTGVVNGLVLIGPAHLADLPASRYGQLLLVKLVLFAAMLGLAALNRYRLTPDLQSALVSGAASGIALRRSLRFEATIGVTILALVAWLGTLAPSGSLT